MFRNPRGNYIKTIKTRLTIAKNKSALWYVAQCSPNSLGEKEKKKLENAMNYSATFCNVNFA